jgi:16S rRNA (guanine966-N2)-methyltransferase
MTRIISGDFKGRSIKVPPSVTRPTSSRVREAVFSSLQHTLGSFDGLQVLDLFAGSGALGFEALSRGAIAAVFVESDRSAVTCIEQNAKGLGENRFLVQKADVIEFVKSVASHAAADLIFIDPPYALTDEQITALLGDIAKNSWIAINAVVVVERGGKSEVSWPESFEPLANKTYGDTSIWYGLYAPVKVEQ